LEAGLPFSIRSVLSGQGWLMSGFKTGLLISFILIALFVHRPWCRFLCPLGGLLALFNRWSLFHLQFKGSECVECNLCRSRCAMGVKLDTEANASNCIRCLECTRCGALKPSLALPGKPEAQTAKPKDKPKSA
jgi:polyferredoxin